MASGNSVYALIENNKNYAQRIVSRERQNLAALQQLYSSTEADKALALRRFAAIRVESIYQGGVLQAEEMDARVRVFLKERDLAKDSLAKSIERVGATIDALTAKLSEADARRDSAQAAMDQAREACHQKFEATEAFKLLNKTLADSMILYTRAKAKSERASAEIGEKMSSYENNPLFSYLLEKHFGTQKYVSRFIVGVLDTWVGNLVHFATNKRHYDLLRRLPDYLAAHADSIQDECNALQDDFDTFIAQQYDLCGVTGLSNDHDALVNQCEDIDKTLHTEQKTLHQLNRELAQFANGEDTFSVKSAAYIADTLKHFGLDKLKQMATDTQPLDDDEIVDTIYLLNQQLARIETQIKAQRKAVDEAQLKVQDCYELAKRFRKGGYHRSSARFRPSLDQDKLLAQFMVGQLTVEAAFDRFRSTHYEYDPPSYSSTRSSYGSIGSSSSSSGGFSTGGGFGGGGYSTGGGF